MDLAVEAVPEVVPEVAEVALVVDQCHKDHQTLFWKWVPFCIHVKETLFVNP